MSDDKIHIKKGALIVDETSPPWLYQLAQSFLSDKTSIPPITSALGQTVEIWSSNGKEKYLVTNFTHDTFTLQKEHRKSTKISEVRFPHYIQIRIPIK
jgi:hypothetical protein